jgi:cbb3-type cytochrome oxidase subunit 3
MNSWNGVSRDWVKYLIYFVWFILMCFAIVILSSYNNAEKRQRCEAKGGTFIENEFESHLSMCVYGKVG